MAILNILREGDPTLRKISRPVQQITPQTAQLLDDMLETMYQADGVGLAAPQVGILRRVVVIDVGDGPVELINPTITDRSGEECAAEGCLSLPGLRRDVKRPTKVTVTAYNRDGQLVEYKGTGLFARAICHEVDHLDGVLFIDRAEPLAE